MLSRVNNVLRASAAAADSVDKDINLKELFWLSRMNVLLLLLLQLILSKVYY
jgi:hypothetical protein